MGNCRKTYLDVLSEWPWMHFPVKGNVDLDSDQNSSSLLSPEISPLGANSMGTKVVSQ